MFGQVGKLQSLFSKSSLQNSPNNKNSLVSSREQISGSNLNLSGSSSGLAFNLLDPMKLMSMKEDAKSRFISSQVMKRSLYESVVSPSNRLAGKRRYSTMVTSKRRPQSYHDEGQDVDVVKVKNASISCTKELSERWRDVQSLPVSPCQSPRAHKRFCGSVASQSRDISSEFLSGKEIYTGSRRSINLSRTSLLLISRKEVTGSGLASILQPPCPKFVSATDLTSPSKEDHRSDSSDSLNHASSNESESGTTSKKDKRRPKKVWNDENLYADITPTRLEPISSGSSLAPSMTTTEDRQSLLSLLAANAENDEDEIDDNGGFKNKCEFLKPKDIPEESMEDQM